ncbi:MAG: aminotransferase class I/II-fold pyridoxal phosphate-dependent enzyme [Deltaproteobacteria bacterium]|nr:aminotransferase class I/II-fold pyridoxal phosphate-dependent enzyme [Deltaproteobacteria bacterium]
MEEFYRIKRLPPYVFNIVNEHKYKARVRGDDIVDFGMGNPDLPTPPHIVEKMLSAVKDPRNHRYSVSRGIYKLRSAMADWYDRRYSVNLDPDTEVVATIGSKEGISHLILAMVAPGDTVIVPDPCYPIHFYSAVIANADVKSVPSLGNEDDFLAGVEETIKGTWPRPKILMLNYPNNPTTYTVQLSFFERVVELAREYELFVIHDLAYSDIVFDGYRAPSLLQVPGAKDIGVEIFTLSKSYNMPGWRVGFVVGNPRLVGALVRIKSYLDYGMFQPIQIASIIALNGPEECVKETVEIYRHRRDVLVEGLNRIGWEVEKPKATMFVWAPIPEKFREMGSLEFSLMAMKKTKVAVSPGIGFGAGGDGHVRFALVENEHRTRQAVRGLRALF